MGKHRKPKTKGKRNIAEVSPASNTSNSGSPTHKARQVDQTMDEIDEEQCDLFAKLLEPLILRLTELEDSNSNLAEKIISLESTNRSLLSRTAELEFKAEVAEQYSRKCNLRISGLKEVGNETTENVVLDTLNKVLKINVRPDEVKDTHRLGVPRAYNNPRPVICQVSSPKIKRRVIDAVKRERQAMKSAKIFISEDLTKERAAVLKKARDEMKNGQFISAWSDNGLVKVRKQDKSVSAVRCIDDVFKLIQPQQDKDDQTYAAAAASRNTNQEGFVAGNNQPTASSATYRYMSTPKFHLPQRNNPAKDFRFGRSTAASVALPSPLPPQPNFDGAPTQGSILEEAALTNYPLNDLTTASNTSSDQLAADIQHILDPASAATTQNVETAPDKQA